MKPLYIFDMDGTLSLIDHRVPILQTKDPDRWDKFYSLCHLDKPNKPVIKVMEALYRASNEIWVVTGRREQERKATELWLSKYAGFMGLYFKLHPERLVMRSNGDFTKDYILKEQWLNLMLEADKNRLMGVFEDRQSVVDMYRRNNITVFQVAKGNF